MSIHPVLKKILDHKREEVDHAKRVYDEARLMEVAADVGSAVSLYKAVTAKEKKRRVIAEIKRSSPSLMLRPTMFDPVGIAKSYEANGAAAISVLTDTRFFCGAPGFVPLVKEAVSVPVLLKDFIIDKYQITEAKALGADAVLLMAINFDGGDELGEMYQHVQEMGLEALFEIHSAKEWEMVEPCKPKLVGINNRDFLSPELKVDITTTLHLAPTLPADVAIVSESGIASPEDMEKLASAGADGFLIGSAFMKEDDPGKALARLIG